MIWPKLTAERDWEEKIYFYYCECVYVGPQGRLVRNGKLRKGRVIFQKHVTSVTVVKAHCNTHMPRRHFILFYFICFSFFLFSGNVFLPVTQSNGYVFNWLFCAPHFTVHRFTEHHIWSVSPQEALLPCPTAPSLAVLAQQRAHIKKTSS